MKEIRTRVTFFEETLGTASNNKEIHAEFIASHAPDAMTRDEEIEAIGVEEATEKGKTVFPRDDEGKPFMWDYQLKGFFKDTCGMIRKIPKTKSSKVKAYKKEIDGLIFIKERRVRFHDFDEIGSCQRPLRASTAQGERISLANSEAIGKGVYIEFTVNCMLDEHADWVREMLNYGVFRGLSQWRNSGKGRFVWEELNEKCDVIGGTRKLFGDNFDPKNVEELLNPMDVLFMD